MEEGSEEHRARWCWQSQVQCSLGLCLHLSRALTFQLPAAFLKANYCPGTNRSRTEAHTQPWRPLFPHTA